MQVFKTPKVMLTEEDLGKGLDNPYLAGRREWSERYGSYIKQAAVWRVIALLNAGIALLAVGGIIYIGSQNKFVPYVVEVDKLGEALAVAPAEQSSTVDPRIIESQLANWIYNVRTVTVDATAERHSIDLAYAMIGQNSSALAAINNNFTSNDPFKLAQTETVNVKIESVLPLGTSTWRVEWEETTVGRDGSTISDDEWQSDLTIAESPPTDIAHIIMNPEGVYITSFSWSKRL